MRRVSLVTAIRAFSKLIKDVEQGEAFLITRRGRAIAKLLPYAGDKTRDAAWTEAHRRMMAHLEEGASLGGLRVDRQEFQGRTIARHQHSLFHTDDRES